MALVQPKPLTSPELSRLLDQLVSSGPYADEADALRAAISRTGARPAAPAIDLAAVMDSVEHAFYALDRDWRYVYINRAAEAYYGRPRESMLGQVIWDAFPWTFGAPLRSRYEEVMLTRQPTTFETHSVRYPERYYEIQLFPVGEGLGVSFRDRTERKLAEEALRASEARYRLAVDAGRLAVWEFDLREGILSPSPELCELLRLPAGETLNLSDLRSRTTLAGREALLRTVEQALQRRDRFLQAELQIRRGDGTHGWFMLRAEIHFDAQRAARRIFGVLLDITDRKEAEEARHESERRLAAAADNMPLSMIYQITSSRDGAEQAFTYVSRSCFKVNGVTPEDALADSQTLHALVLPEHVSRLKAATEEAIRTLKPMDVEVAMRHAATGEVRWFHLVSAPRTLPDGRLIWDGVQIDVTARKRADDAMRASEERLRTVLEQMPVGVMLARMPGGEPLFRNAKTVELLGQEPCDGDGPHRVPLDPEGRVLFGAIHADGRPYAPGEYPLARTVATGETIDQEDAIFRRLDGSTIHLSVSSAVIRGGGETLAVSTLHDTTEQKRAEEHLRLLVNELNHRVKNTLATVQSVAAQSFRNLEPCASAEAARRSFEARLFALARAHDVLTRESWEGADLSTVVREATAPYRGTHAEADPFVLAGPDLRLSPKLALGLSMALHELCTNAVKYGALGGPKGRVEISWSLAEGAAPPRLALRWAERDGPPVSEPSRKGFGTRLIERTLVRELAGEATLSYEPGGLVCEARLPLS
jgi:PAS domain S-box-containing protein